MTTDQRPDERHYRCAYRPCSREERGDAIPKGWIGVAQYPGDFTVRPVRLGLFCSIEHAAEAIADMHERIVAEGVAS